MGIEILIPVTLFVTVFGIIGIVMYYRFRSRQEVQMTVRSVIESGQNLSAEMLEQLTSALEPKHNDLRRGMVFVAIGLGFVALAYSLGEADALGALLGLSAFPFFVGLAHLLLWYLNRDEAQKS